MSLSKLSNSFVFAVAMRYANPDLFLAPRDRGFVVTRKYTLLDLDGKPIVADSSKDPKSADTKDGSANNNSKVLKAQWSICINPSFIVCGLVC